MYRILCLLLVSQALHSLAKTLQATERRRAEADGGLGSGGPQPGDGIRHPEKKQAKRQFFLSPLQGQYSLPGQGQFGPPVQYIYVPYPQVVTVHHVVMLQPPQCPATPGGDYLPPFPGNDPFQRFPPGVPPTERPTPQRPTSTTPMTTLDDRSGPMGGGKNATMPRRPSRCVWAIVACCSPDSTNIRYSCFELLGCPGAFWGVNPCEPKVVQAAANTALNFYMTGEPDDLATNSL